MDICCIPWILISCLCWIEIRIGCPSTKRAAHLGSWTISSQIFTILALPPTLSHESAHFYSARSHEWRHNPTFQPIYCHRIFPVQKKGLWRGRSLRPISYHTFRTDHRISFIRSTWDCQQSHLHSPCLDLRASLQPPFDGRRDSETYQFSPDGRRRLCLCRLTKDCKMVNPSS